MKNRKLVRSEEGEPQSKYDQGDVYKRPITKIKTAINTNFARSIAHFESCGQILDRAQQSPVKVADVVKVFMLTDLILNQIYGAIDQFQIRQIEP